MNKKVILLIIIIIIAILLIVFLSKQNNKETESNANIRNEFNSVESDNTMNKNIISTTEVKVENMETIYIKVNNKVLEVELENNSATKELKEKLEKEDIIVQAKEYGGFEKVGDLGLSLPREDVNITTTPGDIVLYQGNQISMFYSSNTWSYTKLGKVKNIDANELKQVLGSGDVTLTLTLFH